MSLRVWLPLIGTLENKGASDATVVNNGATVNANGKIGSCYAFDGTQYLTLTSNDLKTLWSNAANPFSFAAWIYLNSDETDRVIIIGNYSANPFTNWELLGNCTQRLCAGGTSNFTTKAGGTAVPKETWTHIAVTYDGTYTTFYINGKIDGSAQSGANTLTTMSSNTFYIGSDSRSGVTRLKGRLNDLRVYDHCLSAAEVKEIAQGLVLHYKLDSFPSGYGNPNLLNNSYTLGTGFGGSGAVTQNVFNGFAAKYKDNTSGTSHSDTCTYSSAATVTQGETYTASFWAKADAVHEIRCYFYNNTSGLVQNISGRSSTGSTTTQSDGILSITVTTEWQYYWCTWTFGTTGDDAKKTLLLGRQAAGDSGVYIAAPKLEKGDTATPWAPSIADGYGIFTGIRDSSGYNYHLNTSGTITLQGDTPRYSASSYFNGSTWGWTKTFMSWFQFDECTISTWIKPGAAASGATGSVGIAADSNATAKGITLFNYGNTFRVQTANGSSYPANGSGKALPVGEWHHCVAVLTGGTTLKMYYDGEYIKSITLNWGTAVANANTGFQIAIDVPGTDEKYTGNYSDVRFYSTALSDEDILELYHTGAKIDNKGSLHTEELIESESPQMLKTAQVKGGVYERIYNHYDPVIYTESDGSKWIHIFHVSNPTANKFANTDTFSTSVYRDANRWFNVACCNYVERWELMVKQKVESTTATESVFRWVQNANPMTAAYADVTAAKITKNTSTGYINFTQGGLYYKHSNVEIAQATSSSSSWWGGIGAWTAYNGGIPGFSAANGVNDTETVKTGYIDLYLRIDTNAQLTKTGNWYANNFIEK